MKTLFRVLVFLVMVSLPIYASDYLMLTELGTSAKTIGIANIQGFDYSSNSVFENPATLAQLQLVSVAAFSTKIINELSVIALSASVPSKLGTFGFGYLQGGVDNIYQTTNDNNIFNIGNTFNYSDQTFKFSYSRPIDETSFFGVSLGYYHKSFGTVSGSGSGFDLGYYKQLPQLDVSFVVHNIVGGKVSYTNSQSELLPSQYILSGSMPVFDDVMMFTQYALQDRKPSVMALGVTSSVPGIASLSMSAGYKQFLVLDTVSSGLTLGLEFGMGSVTMDYAFESGNFVEDPYKHYFSISADLDFSHPIGLEILGVK